MHVICKNLHKQFEPSTPRKSRRHTSITRVPLLPDAPLHVLLCTSHACHRSHACCPSNSHARCRCTTTLGRCTATLAGRYTLPRHACRCIYVYMQKKFKRNHTYTCIYIHKNKILKLITHMLILGINLVI